MSAARAPGYSDPEESPEDAYGKRAQEQAAQEQAAEAKRRHDEKAQVLASHEKILADAIKPLQREANPMRQLNVLVTLEQHEKITAYARKNRISLKDLVLTALRPIVGKGK